MSAPALGLSPRLHLAALQLSSPVLCLQPVAGAVGLLQVALQLLLPLAIGRLLLAQPLVFQLQPQERLPAGRRELNRAGDQSPRWPGVGY